VGAAVTTLRLKQIPADVAARLGLTTAAPVAAHSQPSPEEAKRARRKAAKRLHWRIAEAFPAAFCRPDHGPRVALAIGIHRSVAEHCPDLPAKTRRLFLNEYVSRPAYLRLLIPGAPRVALDGSVAGAVTEAEAANAAEKLEQLLARETAPVRRKP
jgi:sRNA-binding protein